MTGLYLHPLRLKALSEGRLSVLRVPMTNLGNVKLVERADPADWNAGRAHPNMRRFEDWYKGDGALFWTDTGSVVFVPAPYAPGDYFVKEAFRHIAHGRNYGVRVQYEYDSIACYQNVFDPCPNKDDKWRPTSWKNRPAATMPEWAARYIVTLGDPVPVRLGEVDVSAMQQEGTFASLMQDPCDMAKQIKDKYRDEWNTIYPRHPWSPDLWTWGYSVTWRVK